MKKLLKKKRNIGKVELYNNECSSSSNQGCSMANAGISCGNSGGGSLWGTIKRLTFCK